MHQNGLILRPAITGLPLNIRATSQRTSRGLRASASLATRAMPVRAARSMYAVSVGNGFEQGDLVIWNLKQNLLKGQAIFIRVRFMAEMFQRTLSTKQTAAASPPYKYQTRNMYLVMTRATRTTCSSADGAIRPAGPKRHVFNHLA